MKLGRARKKVALEHEHYRQVAIRMEQGLHKTFEMSKREAWIYARGKRDGLAQALEAME